MSKFCKSLDNTQTHWTIFHSPPNSELCKNRKLSNSKMTVLQTDENRGIFQKLCCLVLDNRRRNFQIDCNRSRLRRFHRNTDLQLDNNHFDYRNPSVYKFALYYLRGNTYTQNPLLKHSKNNILSSPCIETSQGLDIRATKLEVRVRRGRKCEDLLSDGTTRVRDFTSVGNNNENNEGC